MNGINALAQYKTLKKMNFRDFDRWVTTFYRAAFQDGKNEAQKEFDEQMVKYSEEELKSLLRATGGIDEGTVDKVVDKMLRMEGI